MENPRKRGQYKRRLTLHELQEYQRNHIAVPKGILLPKETTGSNDLRDYLKTHGWFTFKFHGDEYQVGWPDLWASHAQHGYRLIETKSFREGHKLEQTQIRVFTELKRTGIGVWVLRSSVDYGVLFKLPNWTEYI